MLFFKLLSLAFCFVVAICLTASNAVAADGDKLTFDAEKFTTKSVTVDGQVVAYRAYDGIVYAAKPVDVQYQRMNLYVPTAYYEGKALGRFNVDTAPIFMPNMVGGYMPGMPGTPGVDRRGGPNAIAVALSKGFVVAAPGVRGRTLRDESGRFTGKAPACIVDLKAAVRYLRHNDKSMPGDAEKIISNGTSAGGALSALIGATGNAPDYLPYLKDIGAAEERDDIFASSCYCPITNLDHADAAYEWTFGGLSEYKFRGRSGKLSEDQVNISDALKRQFPAYLDSLALKTDEGAPLSLDENGEGSFKDYVKSFAIASAQKALDDGKDLSSYPWLTIEEKTVKDLDFGQFIKFMGRGKTPPAFDALDLRSPENNLFGTALVDNQRFTEYSREHSTDHSIADQAVVRTMNPMNFIGAKGVATAKYWRIRHGAADNDTSLAIPAILSAKLRNAGCVVDFKAPWGVPYSGDYDLTELFGWFEKIAAGD